MAVDVSMYQAPQQSGNDLLRLLLSPSQGGAVGGSPLVSLLGSGSAAIGGSPAAAGASKSANLGAVNAPYTASLEKPSALYGYLRTKGATHNEALMLTGAAANESGFDHTLSHDNGTGYGLFGHNTGRLDMRGMGWQDQATAALNELRSLPVGKAVNSAKSAADLTNAQMDYERPAGWRPGSPQTGHNYTGRLNTIDKFGSALGAPAPETQD